MSEHPKLVGKNSITKKSPLSQYLLRLYVIDNSPNCITAFNNLKQICEKYLRNQYTIERIDLLKFPQLAKEDQILAIPTAVKLFPKPVRKIIGDLSNTEAVLIGLDIHPHARESSRD